MNEWIGDIMVERWDKSAWMWLTTSYLDASDPTVLAALRGFTTVDHGR